MGALLLYILKSTICLTLFYLGFKALLSNDTFFRFNRWVLLGGIVVCMLLPFVKLETSKPLFIQQPIIGLEKIIAGNAPPVETSFPEGYGEERGISAEEPAYTIDWGQLIGLSYLLGCAVCLLITLVSFRKMLEITRQGDKTKCGNYTLILLSSPVSPFSWGRYIILSEEDYMKYPDEILTHEKMHLQYRHSIDLIFMEIILLFHWFNPAVWLLKRELKEIHEYQADKGVLNQGIDATKYQLLLVKKAVGSSLYTLANSFNHSKIKKRITMMLKGKSKNWARLKLLLLVPVGLIVLNAFARPEVNRQLETLIQSKDKETPPNEQQDVREFFRTELDKYISEKENVQNPSQEYMSRFLNEKTDRQDLFVNSLGQILLNNKYATVDNLPEKLTNIFASAKDKPIAFYSYIDAGAPPIAAANILKVVKDGFMQQQAKVGVENVPILFYIGDPKNFKRDLREQSMIVAYYTVNGKKIFFDEYVKLRNRAVRGAVRKADLADAKGEVVELFTYYKNTDGEIVPSPPFYYELSSEEGNTAYAFSISYFNERKPLLSYDTSEKNKRNYMVVIGLGMIDEALGKIGKHVRDIVIQPAQKNVPVSYLAVVKSHLATKGYDSMIVPEVLDRAGK
nr:M56 family metallopeptidase [Parabacteroides goldsteinii]